MDILSNNKVTAFLSEIQSLYPAQFEMIVVIRDLFFEASEILIEDIKYGGLAFSVSDVLIGGIYPYKAYVSIEFSNGSGFTDTENMLEGNGKYRRHLKIYSSNDIAQKCSGFYIKQAVQSSAS